MRGLLRRMGAQPSLADDIAQDAFIQAFEHIRKRYWGQRFWQRGYFSSTSGNITDDIIMRYLDRHTHKDGFSPST